MDGGRGVLPPLLLALAILLTPPAKAQDSLRIAAIVNDGGYSAPIRVPRGRDIMAACGQLKSASEIRRSRRRPEPSTDLRADP